MTFNSAFFSHVVSARDALHDILPFTLSIPIQSSSSFLSYQVDHFTILKAAYPIGQPIRLKENFVIDLKSSTEMAFGGSRPCRSPRRNLLLIDLVEDELARDPGWVKGPHLGSTSPALSRNSTSGPELIPALISAPVPAPAPLSSNELFKQFMRAHLESNQGPRQSPAERE